MTNTFGALSVFAGCGFGLMTVLGNTALPAIPTELTSNATVISLMGFFLWREMQKVKRLENSIKEDKHKCGECPHVKRSNDLMDHFINTNKQKSKND